MKTLFAILGLIAAIILSILDFSTSYLGIAAFIPPGSTSAILAVMPFTFAALALSFNGLSAYLLQYYYLMKDFLPISRMYLVGVWVASLLYDATSSYVGFLVLFAGPTAGLTDALGMIASPQGILALVAAVLATTGPFLTTVFYGLLTEHKEFDLGALFRRSP